VEPCFGKTESGRAGRVNFDAFYPAAMTSSEEVDGGTAKDSGRKYLTPSRSLIA
jgi:hypothetical protein